MKRIFLGKLVHWLLILVLIGLGLYLGAGRLHVRDFNLFVIVLFVVSALAVLIVLRTTRSDEQVTRDPLEPDDDAERVPD